MAGESSFVASSRCLGRRRRSSRAAKLHRVPGVAGVLLALVVSGCASLLGEPGQITVEQDVLGVPIRVDVRDSDSERARSAIARAFTAAEKSGKRLLANRKTSHFGIMNSLPHATWLHLTPVGLGAAQTAVSVAKITNGAYTPTGRPLLDAWGITDANPRVPSDAEIEDAVKRANWKRLEVSAEGGNVRRLGNRTRVDLGGVAVGTMLDAALVRLIGAGVPAGMVSTEGIWTGYFEGETPWQIEVLGTDERGIAVPVAEVKLLRRAFAVVRPRKLSISEDGTRIHEWIDPRSGHPVQGVVTAGVFAKTAAQAAGLAAAAFIEGEQTPEMFRKRPGIQWLVSTEAGGQQSSPGVDLRWSDGQSASAVDPSAEEPARRDPPAP